MMGGIIQVLRCVAVALAGAALMAAGPAPAPAPDEATLRGTVDVGETGWDVRRPVFASACPHGCPWGEIGEFVQDAMRPLGYEVILCRNCNRARGPMLVGRHEIAPELDGLDAATGTTYRFDRAPDFGVTASGLLKAAYEGIGPYAAGGPYNNLRLIAKIEDPLFLLVAVKPETGITDLSQIRERRMPVKILAGGGADAVLAHYGISREDIASWGGSVGPSMGARDGTDFDVIIDDHGTPFMNPEGSHWTIFTQTYDLDFLELPDALLDRLAATPEYRRVETEWGLLQGMDRRIKTVARSGEAIFATIDTPEYDAYATAKAVDEARGELIYLIRRYSLDPRTVADNQGVPLHPGAARYYREMGYIE